MEGKRREVVNDTMLMAMVERLKEETPAVMAVDTETTGLDPLAEGARLLLLQVGLPGETWVVNACKCDLNILKPVLEDPRWLFLLQNAKFDYKWLKARAGIVLPRMYCTMLAELMLMAGLMPDDKRARQMMVGLRALVSKYCPGVSMEKKIRKSFINHEGDEFSDEQMEYAAEDIPHLFTIKNIQVPELKEGGLVRAATIEFRCIGVIGDMELNGIKLDPALYRPLVERYRTMAAEMEGKIQEVLTDRDCSQRDLWGEAPPVNIKSHAQLKRAFAELGVAGVESTEEAALKKIRHPLAALILEFREYDTVVSRYGQNLLDAIHPVSGRLHPNFLQLGSDAGRFSCDDPNVQQVPKKAEFRSCFVAGTGHVMVVGDWSQAELRILAELSQDEGMIEAFNAGLDMHIDTASKMYGIPYDEVDKKGPERQDAKILNFALAYGMGPSSLAASLGCSVDEAKVKMERWFAARPDAGAWLEWAAGQALNKGQSRTQAGRRRFFRRPIGESWKDKGAQIGAIQRAGKNTPIQGSNADWLKLTMRMVSDALKVAGIVGENVGLVACVHDEIVLEVPEDRGAEAAEILTECMSKGPLEWMKSVPVKAEVGLSSCWEK